MAIDIVPELLSAIEQDMLSRLSSSKSLAELQSLIDAGQATYRHAHQYAIEIGKLLAESFKANISSAVLPDGRMYYNIAERILNSTLGHNHELIAQAATRIQTDLNKAAGIGIKGIAPPLNQSRIDGLIERITAEEKYSDIAWVLDEPVVNFSQSIVDDAVKVNADFQSKSGLSPKIIRKSTGKCCEWCDKLTGTYDYESVSDTGNDVFRRHKRCRCTVEFDPRNGKYQNAHTKKWIDQGKAAKIEERKQIGIQESRAKEIQTLINTGEYSLELSAQQHLKHVPGTSQFEQYKASRLASGKSQQGILTISEEQAQSLIKQYSGKGTPQITKGGSVGNKEYATADFVIGKNPRANGEQVDTHRFAIHHGKKGSHIVPVEERDND